MATGRNFGRRQFFHAEAVSLNSAVPGSERATILVPDCEMFRVEINAIGSGATVRYRGTRELQEGGALPVDLLDATAVAAGYAALLSETVLSSGWIPAQPTGVRVEAVGGTATVSVQWLSDNLPTVV